MTGLDEIMGMEPMMGWCPQDTPERLTGLPSHPDSATWEGSRPSPEPCHAGTPLLDLQPPELGSCLTPLRYCYSSQADKTRQLKVVGWRGTADPVGPMRTPSVRWGVSADPSRAQGVTVVPSGSLSNRSEAGNQVTAYSNSRDKLSTPSTCLSSVPD